MNLLKEIYLSFLRIRNSLDFPLRQRFHPRPRKIQRNDHQQTDILPSYPPEIRSKADDQIVRLIAEYHFQGFTYDHASATVRENLFYLAMLDEALRQTNISLPENLTAADIGPSSWFYVHALYSALTWFRATLPRSVRLTGYEVDAYRLYSDLHTRRDHALGNMQGLTGVEYLDKAFTVQPDRFDVITLFFPFVFEKDHLEWGLPSGMFDPTGLLKTAWISLRKGGLMIIVNQGADEHRGEKKLLKTSAIPVAASFHMDPLLFTYPLDRYIITAQK